MKSLIRKSCRYYEWFGDYSLHTCNHKNRSDNFFKTECRDCPYFITTKNYRIKFLESEIEKLNKELAKLKGHK